MKKLRAVICLVFGHNSIVVGRQLTKQGLKGVIRKIEVAHCECQRCGTKTRLTTEHV